MVRLSQVGKWTAAILLASLFFILYAKETSAAGWTPLYNGSSLSAGALVAGETRGAQFNAANFDTLRVSAPNWATTDSSMTLTLYAWNANYAASVAGTPIASKRFVNFQNNSWLEMGFPTQASGDYLWVLSDPSGTPGVWALLDSTHASVGYDNGIATGYDYKSEVYLSNPPLTASIIAPFLSQINTSAAVGQKYEYWASAFRSPLSDTNKVLYLFDWGDGTQSLSGQVDPNETGNYLGGRGYHSWSSPGTYAVKAKAYDLYGAPVGGLVFRGERHRIREARSLRPFWRLRA